MSRDENLMDSLFNKKQQSIVQIAQLDTVMHRRGCRND